MANDRPVVVLHRQLLIVPVGIEMGAQKNLPAFWAGLLIVPVGIEI